jgi:hypothetical protein
MFDRQFFSTILPEHVRAEVAANPGKIPIIQLYLTSGTVLDLCHVVRLADTWVAVAHFCRDDDFDDADISFLPYGTIVRIELAMHDENDRKIGFSTSNPPLEVPADATVPASLAPSVAAGPAATSRTNPTR